MSDQGSNSADAPQDLVSSASDRPDGREETISDGDTRNEFDVFATPVDPEEEDRWPEVPAHLPRSDARSLLHNTSVDEREPLRLAPANPREPRPAQRRRRQRRLEAENERERREEEAEREAQEAERCAAAAEAADKEAIKLNEHYSKQHDLVDVYESSRKRLREEDPEASAEFEQHARYAAVVTQENVRFYDHMVWFQRAPHYVTLSLKNLARSYQEQSRLRVRLNRFERASGSPVSRLSGIEQQAAAGAELGIDGFGLETDADHHITTIGAFEPRKFATDRDEEAYIHAIFGLRRVRLGHETSPELRWPQCDPFEESLDNSVRQFIRAVYSHYIDENDQPHRALSDVLAATLAEMKKYGDSLF